MPIYEYRCQECGHELEKLQRMSDDRLTDCPACGKPQLKRLVSAAGFRLKGGGWYETDFKQGNQRNLAGSDADAGSGKKGEAGGDGGKKADKQSGKQSSASPAEKKSSPGSGSTKNGKAAPA